MTGVDAADFSVSGSAGAADDSPQPLHLGNHPLGARGWDGAIDEVRIATVVRSNAWMATDYASMQDTLLTYGPAEARP